VLPLVLLAALPGQYVDDAVFAKTLQKNAFEATVRTYHPRSRSVGSAVAIARRDGKTYFLTAAHLVPTQPYPGREHEDARSVELYFYKIDNLNRSSSQAIATVGTRMENEDLAVLEVTLPKETPLVPLCPPEKLKIKPPMAVLTVGAIMDGPPELKIDRVTDRKLITKPDGARVLSWEADIPQQQGRSGGPMIDSRGFVIGIASGTEHKKGYYTCIDEIVKSLKDAGYVRLYKELQPPK
jgi:S1-C subfamily serine protease